MHSSSQCCKVEMTDCSALTFKMRGVSFCVFLSFYFEEWTVVQLTLEWDPLSRFPPRNRNVNRGQGIYLSRFSCGGLLEKMNKFG